MTVTIWTPAMIGFFVDLYNNPAHLSFDAMSKAMNAEFGLALTRNALIGKAHRLDLALRGVNPSQSKRKVDKAKTGGRKMQIRKIDDPIAPPLEPRQATPYGLTIYQLREGDCKWPLGPPLARPPFLYCGHQAPIGRPYCNSHTERARGGR